MARHRLRVYQKSIHANRNLSLFETAKLHANRSNPIPYQNYNTHRDQHSKMTIQNPISVNGHAELLRRCKAFVIRAVKPSRWITLRKMLEWM